MSKQEVYHSSTLGAIPLSFTGRRLMQNLREAFQELLQKRVERAQRGQVSGQNDWEDVSKARGKLAQYMSQLEKRPDGQVLEYGPDWRDDPAKLLRWYYQQPAKNEYLVRVVEDAHSPNKRIIRKPNSMITTQATLSGSMHVMAYSMDDALETALRDAREHGFTELTKKDFEVRLLSVPEA